MGCKMAFPFLVVAGLYIFCGENEGNSSKKRGENLIGDGRTKGTHVDWKQPGFPELPTQFRRIDRLASGRGLGALHNTQEGGKKREKREWGDPVCSCVYVTRMTGSVGDIGQKNKIKNKIEVKKEREKKRSQAALPLDM